MPDIPVPEDAITAAALVLADIEGDDQTYRDLAHDVLRAGQPAIRADERRRIGEASRSPDESERTGLFRLARADGALAERARLAAAAECTTMCKPDCELRPDGCHESHQPVWKRTHQPGDCARRRAQIAAAVEAERERIRQLAAYGRATLTGPDGFPVAAVPLDFLRQLLGDAGGVPSSVTGDGDA